MGRHAFTEIAPAPKVFDGSDVEVPEWNGVHGENARIDIPILDDTVRHTDAPLAVELQLTIAQAEQLIRDIRSEIAYARTEEK